MKNEFEISRSKAYTKYNQRLDQQNNDNTTIVSGSVLPIINNRYY